MCPEQHYWGRTLDTLSKRVVARSIYHTTSLTQYEEYRQDVGRQTREIISKLRPQDLWQPVQPSCLQRVIDEGAVTRAAQGLLEYLGRSTIAGLLMPPTQHNFVHPNQAARLQKRFMV